MSFALQLLLYGNEGSILEDLLKYHTIVSNFFHTLSLTEFYSPLKLIRTSTWIRLFCHYTFIEYELYIHVQWNFYIAICSYDVKLYTCIILDQFQEFYLSGSEDNMTSIFLEVMCSKYLTILWGWLWKVGELARRSLWNKWLKISDEIIVIFWHLFCYPETGFMDFTFGISVVV